MFLSFLPDSFRQHSPCYSGLKWEGVKAKLGDGAVHTSRANERQNEFKNYTSKLLIVFCWTGKLALSLKWPNLLPWNFKPVAFSMLSTGGFIILRWEKFLRQKAAWEKNQSDLSSACVCWRRKRIPSWHIREVTVSSDAFFKGGWIPVQPTLFFFFLTLRYYFNEKPPQVLSKSQLWRKMSIPIKPQRIVGVDGNLNLSVRFPSSPSTCSNQSPPPPTRPTVQEWSCKSTPGGHPIRHREGLKKG